MTGSPVIRGTRLTVEYILNLLAHGASEEEILAEYKRLMREDIQACLLLASDFSENIASQAWSLTQAERDKLDRRLEVYRSNPREGASWEAVQAKINNQ